MSEEMEKEIQRLREENQRLAESLVKRNRVLKRTPRCMVCKKRCEPSFRSHDNGWLCPDCWQDFQMGEIVDPSNEAAMSRRIEQVTDKLYRRRMKDE